MPRNTSMPKAVMSSGSTPTRRCDTVSLLKPKKLAILVTVPAPAPDKRLGRSRQKIILRRYERLPLCKNIDQKIASAINGELFHQQARAHIRIMNAKMEPKGESRQSRTSMQREGWLCDCATASSQCQELWRKMWMMSKKIRPGSDLTFKQYLLCGTLDKAKMDSRRLQWNLNLRMRA